MFNMSRRTVLKIATAASATILVSDLSSQTPATAAALPPVEIYPGAIATYLEKMPIPRNLSLSDTLTLDDVRLEYRDAVAIFPLVLPQGWQFPADPGLFGGPAEGLWQRGSGTNAAYVTWHRAFIEAAYAGHQRGRVDSATRHLDLLEAGYGTQVRKAALEDPDNFFLGGAGVAKGAPRGPLASARAGDFAEIRRFLGS